MSKKTCLVTGAAGFIGSHLVDRLLGDGHEVFGVDNFTSGRPENLKLAKENPNFKFYNKDVSKLAKGAINFDWVFHLAARADIVPSIWEPMQYYETNVLGTLNILDGIRLGDSKSKMIYAASSSCYGIPSLQPTVEATPCRPRYPYAYSKLAGETAVMDWAKLYRFPAVSLRLFNVYGPRARTSGAYGAVMGTFLTQKYHGEKFTVVGDGEQSRDFTFVTDVVDAFVRAAEYDVTEEIFNISANDPQSINHLVGLLGGDSNSIVRLPERPGEPRVTWGSNWKANEFLNWSPKVKFEDGVKACIKDIEDFKDAPLWNEKSIAEATKDWFKYLS